MKAMCLAFALLGGACHADGISYAQAVREYQQGHWSAAYGGFMELANNGHRDAARIALFMHRYGPELFTTRWAATDDELQSWARLAVPRNKLDPEMLASDAPRPAPRPLQKARTVPFHKTR
jgi:hypothetical protein